MIERAVCPILVGREQELSALDDALIDVALGQARVVSVAGEAGLGKTRLASEVRRRAQRLGFVVLWGGCSEAGLTVPYLPFVEAFGNHLAHADIAALRARLGTTARELARLLPQFGIEPVVLPGDDPNQGKLRLFEAVVALLGAVAGGGPLLVVLEDLHWADGSTHELIDYTVRRLTASPVMLLVTYRRDEVYRGHPLHPTLQAWRRSRLAHTIELGSLPPPQVATIVCAILDEPQLSTEFTEYLHRRSDGNPFVLEEMINEAVENGDIYRSGSGWERKSIVDLRIPATVRDTILSRLDRLDPSDRDVLRSAAVIGAGFDFDTLADLSNRDAAALDETLRTCAQQQFLEEAPAESGALLFRHSITRETIYEDISAAQRAHIHHRIATVMESRGGAPGQRAAHLAGAGRVAEAVPLWIEAGDEAVSRHAYSDAVELYARALAHVEDPVLRARTHGSMGYAMWAVGGARVADAIVHLNACVAELDAAGQRHEAASHRLLLGRCLWMLSDTSAARREYTTALHVLEPLGTSEELANAYLRLGGQESIDCHWDAAERLLQRAIDIATEVHADAVRIGASLMIAAAILERDVNEGLAVYDRACQEAMDRDLDLLAGNALANTIVARCDVLRARDCLPLLESLRQRHASGWSTRAATLEGYVHLYLGDAEQAVRALNSSVIVHAPGDRNERERNKHLAVALAVMGRTEEAMRHGVRPDPSRAEQDIVFETIAWTFFHLASGTPGEALGAVDAVLERFDGLPPWRVHGPHELADRIVAVLVATGDLTRARGIAAEVERLSLTWSPYGKRARARALLAGEEHAAAAPILRRAAAEFEDAGYRLDMAETRLLLARALHAGGDDTAATQQARAALTASTACKAKRLSAEARELLHELGNEDRPADAPVRAEAADVASGHTIVVAAAAEHDHLVTLEPWLRRRFGSVGGTSMEASDGRISARFEGGDGGLVALEFAVAMHAKAVLDEVHTGVGIALQAAPARDLAELGDGVWISEEAQRLVQPPLGGSRVVISLQPAADHGAYGVCLLASESAVSGETAETANVFRRDGEYWTVARGRTVIRIRDSKGMRDLAVLLAHPRREVTALALVAGTSRPPATAAATSAMEGMGVAGDVGPALDDEARHQFRERLQELDAEIDSAEADNDPERASRAREEREFLLAELGAAVGLGGRNRRMLDPTERARKTVTWRIRDSIARITAADARLGDHFRRSVRTGVACVYDPTEPATWEL